MASQSSAGTSSRARSFCCSRSSNSADSPPQKTSASGRPFHLTIASYDTGVPARSNRVFSVTPKRSRAYWTKSFSIESTTKADIGVWTTSSSSMGAARAAAGVSVRTATTNPKRSGRFTKPPGLASIRLQDALGLALGVPHGLRRRLDPGQRGLEVVVERLDHALVVVGGQLRHRVAQLVAGDGGRREARHVLLHDRRRPRVPADGDV